MFEDKLLDRVPFSITENGGIKISHTNVCVRDAALICYYLIKNDQQDKAVFFIDNLGKEIGAGKHQYHDMVFWLWVLGEYINYVKNHACLERLSGTVDACIDYIYQQWKKPRSNWLGIFDEGIYISNIAMAYGAVQSINNAVRSGKAQKLLIDIQEFVFKKFLNEGKVVSRLGDKEIFGDISIIAVPFGLINAGNQILVESINVLEKTLVERGVRLSQRDMYYGGCIRSDLTCLLSWYYSERGDIARAKWLLDQVDAIWERDGKLYVVDRGSAKEKMYYNYYMEKNAGTIDESHLSYVLYAIANRNIAYKEQAGFKSTGCIDILHSVEGTRNKYLRGDTERYPNHPIEGDSVFLRMITQPFNISQQAYVEYSLNGIPQEKVKMKVETSREGEKYWEACIGHFAFGDEVEYRFAVQAENLETFSPKYQFIARGWKSVGVITRACKSDDGIILNLTPLYGSTKVPCLMITKHADRTVKWSFYMDNIESINDGKNAALDRVDIKLKKSDLEVDIEGISISISDDMKGNILQSYKRHGERFIELLIDKSGTVYKIRYKFLIKSEENFFGMGERYSRIGYRGYDIDNYVYSQYTNQGLRTYIPVPFAISSKGYGVYADTTMYSVFRFGTRLLDMFEVEIDINKEKQSADVYVFIGNAKEVIQSFVNITGKPELPPKWAFGLWMSSNNWNSQAEIFKQVGLTRKYEIPATVLVLERWSDEATFYIFNDAQYQVKDGNDYLRYEDFSFPEWGRWPDPKKMVDDLHKEGLKVIIWQAPVQKYMDGIAHAQRDEDERVMLEKGYCVKDKRGGPYRIPPYEWFKRSLVPDFSNPAAREWWLNKRKYLVKVIGIDGFKTDGGECIYGEDLLFHDGRTGDEMRNQYPNDYIESFHKFAKKYVSDGAITFSRAGYTGAQRFPMHWAGDENSTFKAYRASINAGLSCSMSGIPFWGWDMGGFHGEIPSAELYIRSVQMAAFCPVMQYHTETKGEHNRDRTPWNIAERTAKPYVIDIFKKYANLRMNLMPYIYQQAMKSSNTGIPMMRAMFLEYPDDESSLSLTEQYFFGGSLLIAPVTEEACCTKDIYLPEGKWMEFFDGHEILGSSFIRVKADIDKIPVYIKENSIIPMNLSDNYKLSNYVGNKVNEYNNLCFVFHVTDSIKYQFVDDLGNDIDISSYKKGDDLQINISGNLCQPITLLIRNYSNVQSITLDDKIIQKSICLEDMKTNTYFICDNDLLIKINCEKIQGVRLLEIRKGK